MKDFLAAFVMCFVVLMCMIGFGILENIWVLMVLISLLFAGMLTALLRQDTRLEMLEKRVQALETDGAADIPQN